MKKLFTTLVVLVLVVTGTWAQTPEKPIVYILATGGTIAGSGDSAVASAYVPGAVGINQMLAVVPEILDIADIRGEQVASIASQNMTNRIWLDLSRRVNELLAQDEVAGVIITHGTDTQEETAYFLNLTVRSDKPVVMVGSMRPGTALSPDGPRNIYNAVACAVAPESRGQGVMIVMDDRIIGADDVTKTHTLDVSTFQDPNYGQLGMVYNGKPVFTRQTLKRHTAASEFDVTGLTELPRVEVILAYANATDLFVDAAIRAGAKGIVVAGVGNGNMSDDMLTALEKARKEQDIAVVRSSRIMTGPTTQWGETDDEALNFVASWYINPYKARVLLMLALTKTTDYREIQRMFTEY